MDYPRDQDRYRRTDDDVPAASARNASEWPEQVRHSRTVDDDPASGERAEGGLSGNGDPFDSIGRLVSAIGAEIEALKQEREAAHVRTARIRLGTAYAKARLERRSSPR